MQQVLSISLENTAVPKQTQIQNSISLLWVSSLHANLQVDEGYRQHPYQCTANKTTIAYGRNLTDVGISRAEAAYLLDNDLDRTLGEIERHFPFLLDPSVPDGVKSGVGNMLFNLGLTRLLCFKKMLSALEAGDYKRAAAEALDSKYADDVGERAVRVADRIRTGDLS